MSVVAAMLVTASAAHAAGVNVSWSKCAGEAGALANKTFACTANTGAPEVLVCSFVLDNDLAGVSGNEVVIDFLTTSNPIPQWWEMKDPLTCRQTALSANGGFDVANVVCQDWAQGQSTVGIGSYNQELGSIDGSLQTQHRRLKIALAVPGNLLQDLLGNTDYFACNVSISHTKTVGTPSCAGCLEPVCVVLNSIKITTPTPANDIVLGQGTSPGSNIVTWQGTGPNCAAVPVKNVTWGQVKSLYR